MNSTAIHPRTTNGYNRGSFSMFISLLLCFLTLTGLQSQDLSTKPFFAPADSLDKTRFYTGLSFTTVSFTATSIGLYNSWYKQFEQSSFHLFNDWNEWERMDKMGHAFTSYNLCHTAFQGAQWSGLSKKGSLLFAGIGSTAIQTTIEIMDGYSTKWGFSLGDVAFNTLGTSLYILQQGYFDEQKVRLKLSYGAVRYPDLIVRNANGAESSVIQRSDQLFGEGGLEKFLKDYNGQTLWLSLNLSSIMPQTQIPKWLNVSLGYSGQNMLGGFENSWEFNGNTFEVDQNIYPRHRQYLLSLDVDLNRIKTKNHFVNMLLLIANGYKIPAPAIEYNSLGEWKFHLIFRS